MDVRQLTPFLSVSPQILPGNVGVLAARGFKSIVNNGPDGESDGQPRSAEIAAAARRHGLDYRHIPAVSGAISDQNINDFRTAMAELAGPVLAFCRTGTRSASLWALSEAPHLDPDALLRAAAQIGYDLKDLRPRLEKDAQHAATAPDDRGEPIAARYDVVIVGGGAGGISTAASLLTRKPHLKIAIVEPREVHYYQPGWTLVGGGVFDRRHTQRPTASHASQRTLGARGSGGLRAGTQRGGSRGRFAAALPCAGRQPRDPARLGCHSGPAPDARAQSAQLEQDVPDQLRHGPPSVRRGSCKGCAN